MVNTVEEGSDTRIEVFLFELDPDVSGATWQDYETDVLLPEYAMWTGVVEPAESNVIFNSFCITDVNENPDFDISTRSAAE
jgi:hypothetical protein